MNNVTKILKRAITVLKRKNSWIKGDLAVDRDQHSVEPQSDKACRFCMVGAIRRAQHELGLDYNTRRRAEKRVDNFLLANENRYHADCAINYNDDVARRKSQVINVLTRVSQSE
jgi:hypothetical protein